QKPELTTSPSVVVGDNLLETSLSVSVVLKDIPNGDYHLVQPIGDPFFIPNPAFNQGDTWAGKSVYGAVGDDIDGDRRPASAAEYDLGADED
ncbi:MAG: hypothetical protein HKN12_09735, partial [Gemmatimonadetes bacterium]|nr:hypothetical protein [Gemmatimonadota bacterium]